MNHFCLLTFRFLLVNMAFWAGTPGSVAQTGTTEKPTEQKTPPPLVIPDDMELLPDLQYALVGTRVLALDVIKPKEKRPKPRPVIVWVHGGGWRNGNKEGARKFLLEFAKQGYVCATVGYRYSTEAPFPAQIHDLKAALRYLRANADRFGLDPRRVGVWGSSAGGHLAALLGTTSDTDDLDGAEGNPGVADDVQAVCDWFGPTNLLNIGHDDTDQLKHNELKSAESQLVGGPVQENREKAIQASPVTHVSRNDPPFLIMHGDADAMVPIKQSETFAKALQDKGVDVTFIPVPGEGHGFKSKTKELHQKVLEFFDKHLKK